jgi:hypothetical protein
MSLSGSTATSAAMEMMAESHRSIASSVAQQTRMQQLKDQMSALQIKFTMRQGVGDLNAARFCISHMQHLRTPLAAITTTASASSFTEEHPPFEQVDLTNEEVNLTNVEDDDNEVQQDVEVMYSNDINETEAQKEDSLQERRRLSQHSFKNIKIIH